MILIPGVRAPLATTLDGVFSPEECAALIRRIDAAGPTAAPVTTHQGPVMMPDIRNNTRVMFDDAPLAAELYRRVAASIPQSLSGLHAVGANERIRCYRYEPGQRFAPHFDGAFRRDENERSLLTLILYLNEEFTGGATAFLDFDVQTTPRTGRVLWFQHKLYHEGCAVTTGVKYVLRSDVMYRKLDGSGQAASHPAPSSGES